jgi:hypothetical protein
VTFLQEAKSLAIAMKTTKNTPGGPDQCNNRSITSASFHATPKFRSRLVYFAVFSTRLSRHHLNCVLGTAVILQLRNMCSILQDKSCMIIFMLSTRIAIDRFRFVAMDLYTHILELISEDRLLGITKWNVFF